MQQYIKQTLGSGNTDNIKSWNEKIVKRFESLEDSGLLPERISETI